MQLVYLEVDEQLNRLHRAVRCADHHAVTSLAERFDASWIYHDLSIEGSIFRDNELQRALQGREGHSWRENQLLEKVRNMRRAIVFIRGAARAGRPFDLEFVKDIHRHLRPPDEETAGRYRKESGESSAYRHDLVSPKTISYRLRRLVSFVDSAAKASLGHPINLACQIHRELMEVFPFQQDNGIVARLAMNFWILRHGYSPAVFHVQDRQRYFDTYLCENSEFRKLVVDSILQSADAWIRGLSEVSRIAVAN